MCASEDDRLGDDRRQVGRTSALLHRVVCYAVEELQGRVRLHARAVGGVASRRCPRCVDACGERGPISPRAAARPHGCARDLPVLAMGPTGDRARCSVTFAHPAVDVTRSVATELRPPLLREPICAWRLGGRGLRILSRLVESLAGTPLSSTVVDSDSAVRRDGGEEVRCEEGSPAPPASRHV